MWQAWRLSLEVIATMARQEGKSLENSFRLPWPTDLRVTPIRKKWHERLCACPTGLSLKDLAKRLGQPYASVASWAKVLGYPSKPLKRGRKTQIPWDTLDWSLTNAELARQVGVSGERVRQVRLSRNGESPARSLQHEKAV